MTSFNSIGCARIFDRARILKYGCGWIIVDIGGLGRAMTHGGSNTNSKAMIWILPNRDFAAVACTNTGEQSGFPACDAAIQELMKRNARVAGKG